MINSMTHPILRLAFLTILPTNIYLSKGCVGPYVIQGNSTNLRCSKNDIVDGPESSLYGVTGSVHSIVIEFSDPDTEGPRKPYRKVTFDPAGCLIEVRGYRGDGVGMPPNKSIYERGRLVKEQFYKTDGTLWLETIYEYAASGEVFSKVQQDVSDGSTLAKTLFSTDPRGNTIEAREYNPAGEVRMDVIYSKDSKGRVVELEVRKGITKGKRLIDYNEKGDFSQVTFVDPDDGSLSQIVYQYEYDPRGNWVKRTGYYKDPNSGEVGSKNEIIHRTISYR